MAPNDTFIAKADEFVAQLAPGGLLVAEQSAEFLELATLKSKLLSKADVFTTENPQFEKDKLGFLGEVLRPATEGQALVESERSAPTHGKTTFTPKEYMAEIHISYDAVEDNIKRERFPEFLKGLAAKAVARDLEKAIIQGDTAGTGSRLLKSLDGLIKTAVSHPVAGGGSRLTKTLLTKMMRAMPEEYEGDEPDWVFFTNKNAAIDYWDSFADRQTSGGDEARTGKPVGSEGAGRYGLHGGIPIESIPLWPRNLGGTTDRTTVVLCNPKNIGVCFRRDVTIEAQKNIKKRLYEVVFTVRFDAKWIHEDAVVQASDILASA